MQAGDILTQAEAADTEAIRDALENLIYWADQAAPDLPDTVRIECLTYALDNARQILKGQQ
jgi:hypothetical protein